MVPSSIGREDDVVAVGALDLAAICNGSKIGMGLPDEHGEVGVRAADHLRVDDVDLATLVVTVGERGLGRGQDSAGEEHGE